MADARSQLARIARLANDVVKTSLPPADRTKLRNAIVAYVQAAQKEAGAYADLIRQLDAQVAARLALDAKDKALSARAKAALKANAGWRASGGSAAVAINEALKKAPNDRTLKALKKAMTDLGMEMVDYSPFQVLPDW